MRTGSDTDAIVGVILIVNCRLVVDGKRKKTKIRLKKKRKTGRGREVIAESIGRKERNCFFFCLPKNPPL